VYFDKFEDFRPPAFPNLMMRDMAISVIGGVLFMACDLIPRAIRFRLSEVSFAKLAKTRFG